jgi:hypothetical protein
LEEKEMKSFLRHTLVALMICALGAVAAFADSNKNAKLTLATDVMVNGTLVKAGEYDFKFNEKTNELTILKNGKVKAKTTARLETRNDKAKNSSVRTRSNGNSSEIVGLTFGGSNQEVVVASGGASTVN